MTTKKQTIKFEELTPSYRYIQIIKDKHGRVYLVGDLGETVFHKHDYVKLSRLNHKNAPFEVRVLSEEFNRRDFEVVYQD